MPDIHPLIKQDVSRMIGYHWNNAMILSIIYYRYRVRLSHYCVDNLRSGKPCTRHCKENCYFG